MRGRDLEGDAGRGAALESFRRGRDPEDCGSKWTASRFAEVPDITRVLDERWHTSGGRVAELARRMMGELTAADSAGPIAAEGLALELLAELARIRAAATGAGTRRPG